jgi:hypothetical protein
MKVKCVDCERLIKTPDLDFVLSNEIMLIFENKECVCNKCFQSEKWKMYRTHKCYWCGEKFFLYESKIAVFSTKKNGKEKNGICKECYVGENKEEVDFLKSLGKF